MRKAKILQRRNVHKLHNERVRFFAQLYPKHQVNAAARGFDFVAQQSRQGNVICVQLLLRAVRDIVIVQRLEIYTAQCGQLRTRLARRFHVGVGVQAKRVIWCGRVLQHLLLSGLPSRDEIKRVHVCDLFSSGVISDQVLNTGVSSLAFGTRIDPPKLILCIVLNLV